MTMREFRMSVNEVSWSLQNKVPWVSDASIIRVSWLAYVAECLECQNTRVSTEHLQSAHMEQNFGSLFVRLTKSVRNATLTEWFSGRNCEIQVVEFTGHILESKRIVQYCWKGHNWSLFSKTLIKNECF